MGMQPERSDSELKFHDMSKIGIDALGRLVITPKRSAGENYESIYGAGMEVSCNSAGEVFLHTSSR
jgi:hypothetical protein